MLSAPQWQRELAVERNVTRSRCSVIWGGLEVHIQEARVPQKPKQPLLGRHLGQVQNEHSWCQSLELVETVIHTPSIRSSPTKLCCETCRSSEHFQTERLFLIAKSKTIQSELPWSHIRRGARNEAVCSDVFWLGSKLTYTNTCPLYRKNIFRTTDYPRTLNRSACNEL